MKVRHVSLLFITALLFAMASALCRADAPDVVSCEQAVASANVAFKQQSGSEINSEKDLVELVRILNRDNVLPIAYVTTQKAKEAGWDGTGSLWSKFILNKKIIGGDPYLGKPVSDKGSWFTADLESVSGHRSSKRLIYSPNSKTRYLSTELYESAAEIVPCR
ncbi:ribonuclease [Leminorella grimontii]|uniref:ribonuclease n=1 Tax=Leminorella grimontii TaxID=82981 RepID=UPI00321F95A1